jgi:hypothetical protein
MMEFKSEYRWLLFLSIPFVILLAIHVAIPLSFWLTTQNPLIKEYTDENIGNLVVGLRTFSLMEGKRVSSQLATQVSWLNILRNVLETNSSYVEMNTTGI